MTADAKVGLLLGLVFIAIIAFVINGLPDFVQSAGEKPVVQTAVNTQTGSSLVIEPAVVDVARSLQEKRTTVRYVDPPVDTTVLENYAGGSSTAPVKPSTDDAGPVVAKTQEVSQPEKTVETVQKPVNSTEVSMPENVVVSKTQEKPIPSISHKVEAGESLGEIAKKYYGEQEGNKLSTIQMLYEANKSILESPDAIQVGDELVIPKVKTAAVSDPTAQTQKETAGTLLDKFKNVFTTTEKKTEPAAKTSQADDKKTTARPQAPVADKTSLLKTDKVQPVKKESLAPVADKTTLLKTDKVQPVKINSPAPVADKTTLLKTDKVQPVKPDSQVSVADKTALTKVDKPLPLNKGVTEYTIQSGDYLYKIAEKQLGDGNRYPEILKLNSGLSEKDRLKVGTKLRIPKK
jgi:nucleoid-associated protein YgaU